MRRETGKKYAVEVRCDEVVATRIGRARATATHLAALSNRRCTDGLSAHPRPARQDMTTCMWLDTDFSGDGIDSGKYEQDGRPAAEVDPLEQLQRLLRQEYRARSGLSGTLPRNPLTSANVKACEGAACTLLFVDHTRSRARRWCSMAICGNRAKQAAHRRRLKARHQQRLKQNQGRARSSRVRQVADDSAAKGDARTIRRCLFKEFAVQQGFVRWRFASEPGR